MFQTKYYYLTFSQIIFQLIYKDGMLTGFNPLPTASHVLMQFFLCLCIYKVYKYELMSKKKKTKTKLGHFLLYKYRVLQILILLYEISEHANDGWVERGLIFDIGMEFLTFFYEFGRTIFSNNFDRQKTNFFL